ncbi:MAG: ABC transporter ATP-binding protein [Candidatus Paceibacterota bacterium]|nr:ABC transporter ATP-binding protein [Candidatus Paceibacterota bacterium]MDD4201758.1 ABC transporter ATP-binding protein [Candidatus Paceibacterota bacterium]MDD4897267.1 ABC transporter ATP-binding protein [Candidatus Paceibacterota bacterium]
MEFLKDLEIIWDYLKNYKKRVFFLALLAVFFAVFEGLVPYIYGKMVDMVLLDSPFFLILFLVGIWALTSILSELSKRIVSLRGSYLSVEAMGDFVFKIFSSLIYLPLSFHKEKNTGDIVSRITRAGDALQFIMGDTIFWIIPRFLTVIIGLAILFFINWQLSLGALLIFILSGTISILRTPLLIENQKSFNKKIDVAAGILNDSFINIQTIKSSGAEYFQKEKIKKIYEEEINPSYKKVVLSWENTEFLQELFFSLGFMGIFAYAVFLTGKGDISQGTLVMFLGYLNLIRMPLKFLLWQWLSLQKSLARIKRAREFFKIAPEKYNKRGKLIKELKGKVEYKNVFFSYSERKNVLKNISFSTLPGQKVALVGGSGEGKTTMVDLLSLYFVPKKGKILIDGIDTKHLNLNFLRKIIAYVPQDIVLFNDSIKNNILYGNPEATKEELLRAARAANISHFIETLPRKYNTIVGERGIKLSTGQKQRLAIARAIIRNPKILILDEATSSLDVKSEKLIQEALENLIKNKTTFIIAHRLSTVRKADKILVIEKGEIVEEGTHDELIKRKGMYYNLYQLQFTKKRTKLRL